VKISSIKKAYFIGIKGAGMVGVAQILRSCNIEVSGSDTGEVFYTNAILKRCEIPFYEEFSLDHVPRDADIIIYSTAYNEKNNVEISEAKKLKIPIISYPEALGMLFKEKRGIAVCGTHGKTTTSAMLAETLADAELNPSAIVGSQVISWQGSALAGKGKYFVAEADEYQNKLMFYEPWSVILTSLDWDHPDFFPDFSEYKKVFKSFLEKVPKEGFLVVWGDNANTLEVSRDAKCKISTYGFSSDCDYVVMNHKSQIANDGKTQSFEVFHEGKSLGIFMTPLVGKHNALNTTAVIALCHEMQLDMEKIKTSLKKFRGTSRRFEQIGMFKNSILIDDYAHHPDEIRATLKGAREYFEGKKIWAVFHPHTFTRTKALLQEFAQSFGDVDKVIVIDIYGSAREQQGGVSSKELVDLINKYYPGRADYIPNINDTSDFLKEAANQYDVLITMGAGDVWKIAEQLKSL